MPLSGWPAPSLDEYLDSAKDSQYFSSIDSNSVYHQISCTQHTKEALASLDYGFPWKSNFSKNNIKNF